MSSHPLIYPIKYLADATPYFMGFKALGKRVWLDSGKPHSNYGDFDIISAAPLTILINPSTTEIEREAADAFGGHDLNFLQDYGLPFWGGVLGYFNYEYNARDHGIGSAKAPLRDSRLGLFDWALLQNHRVKKSYLVFLPNCRKTIKHEVLDLVGSKPDTRQQRFSIKNFKHDLAPEKYFQTIAKIKDYILAGDTYQINFAQRFSGDFSGDTDAAYLSLRNALPSPFSAFIELGDDTVMSLSPERFIRITDNAAITQPIKGTAPRGTNTLQDKQLADELKKSEKNRAENLMIVDLLRNDFSQSCEPFSVRVPTLFELESFANVHHLVSAVEGTIKPGISPLEFLMRCFPGGSITGAPKRRSMEIIHQLEDHPRNIYCGSVCYLSALGNFDSNIAIRTLLVSDNKIYCWGGGGIVADSEAEDEFNESIQKIKVLIDSLKAHSSK